MNLEEVSLEKEAQDPVCDLPPLHSEPGSKHSCLLSYRYMMLCRMEAKGVIPIPAPIRTACSEAKICLVGVPYGPST